MDDILNRILKKCDDAALVAAYWLNVNTDYEASIEIDAYKNKNLNYERKRQWEIREGDMVLFSPEPGYFLDENVGWSNCACDCFYDNELIEFAKDKGYNEQLFTI